MFSGLLSAQLCQLDSKSPSGFAALWLVSLITNTQFYLDIALSVIIFQAIKYISYFSFLWVKNMFSSCSRAEAEVHSMFITDFLNCG